MTTTEQRQSVIEQIEQALELAHDARTEAGWTEVVDVLFSAHWDAKALLERLEAAAFEERRAELDEATSAAIVAGGGRTR